MTEIRSWTISGSDGEPIIGDCHLPDGEARGVILIAHGFKGYKDYGMFPRLARTLADRGFIAHRFNFSHSGMTNDTSTFARPELFERDTWNKQVHDYRAVIDAVAGGEIAGTSLPYVMFGHSRGGATALLTAGRFADDDSMAQPAGVITAAAPASCCNLDAQQQEQLLDAGYLVSPSSRTGQDLRVGKAWLQEQLDDPAGHDVIAQAQRTACPLLFIHGEEDPTVSLTDAEKLGAAVGGRGIVQGIPRANHVFNTPNPLPEDAEPSPQLQQLLDSVCDCAERICG